MASEMVERVRDAILAEAGEANDPKVADDVAPEHMHIARLYATRYARAAIEAMREPTSRMSNEGRLTIKGAADETERAQAEYAWRSMISAALYEKIK